MAAALLAATLSATGGAAQDGTPVPFRPACDLIDAAAVSGIVGDTLTADEAPASIACSFSTGGEQQVVIQLIADQTLPLLRLTVPAAAFMTLGDRTALVTPGDAKQPAGTVVALDDGVLVVNVTSDAPTDAASASTAIAQAILEGGPVSARLPETSGLTPLTFEGDLCDLVTAKDLKQELGSKFQVAMHDATECTYTGGTARSQEYVSLALLGVALSMMRTKGTTDTTVADRPAILIPRSGALMVDIGGSRVLQLVLGASPTPKGAAARKLARQMEHVAADAIGRMTPVVASAPPATAGVCGLLSLEVLSSSTGIDFTRVAPLGDTGCDYTSADERTGILVFRQAADSLDTAWSNARQTLPVPEKPTPTTVGGHPALDGLIGSDAAAVAVDLAGLPDGDGKVLGLLLLADPAAPGDPLATALRVTDLVIQASTSG